MSELFKQPKSPYWFYTLNIDGKRVRRSTKQRDKNKAKTVLREAEQKVSSSGVDALTRKACTLEEFMPTFLAWVRDSQRLKDSTRRFYRCGADLLLGTKSAPNGTKLAEMKLDSITQGACDTTVFPGGAYNANKGLRTLRKLLAVAQERKTIFGQLPKIKMREVVGRSMAMSRSDAELIAAKMPEGDAKDCFLVLRGTGMRPSEAMSMRWEFVKFDEGIYQNPGGKTKSARRVVPLLNGSVAVLQSRHLAQGLPVQGWVFPAESKVGHTVTIGKAFNAARDAAKLPKSLVLYTARHGALTDLANVLSVAETMMIGGHSDVRTAISYQHPKTINLQEKLDALQKQPERVM